MNSETVHLRNGRAWQVYSGGRGADLLWLHGVRGVDADDPILVALQRSYRVTAPVAPGFNGLDELARIDNIHELALDYEDLMEGLGLDAVAVVGHSFGAMIAAEIAAHFPRRVSRLVLLAPFGLWNERHPVADIFAYPYAQLDDLLWHDAKARDAFAKPASDANDIQATADQMIKLVQSLTAITKFVWPIPDRGLRRRLPRIACPALAVFGAQDGIVPPSYADDFAAGLRHGRTAVVADAGHMLPYEQPNAVLGLLDGFLGQPQPVTVAQA
jgi:pimeloyl-ACP methyl ester carboxylesterase